MQIRKLACLLIIPLCVKAQPGEKNDFRFHLNHVDMAVDSLTFYALLNSRFIAGAFSSTKIFRDSTGMELLVRGQEHWLHFLPDKGFYKHRLGAVVLQHNSYVWMGIDTLMKHLQSFTSDSLYNRPYRSGGENTDHVHVYEELDDTLSLLKFIPQLQKFSKADYLSWGYTEDDLANGISQEREMRDYVGKETADKLFKSIRSIHVSISPDEEKRMPPLLEGYGYRRAGDKFYLPGSPVLFVNPVKNNTRVNTIHIQLTKPVRKKTVRISENCTLVMAGKDAWLSYSISLPNQNVD